jgi:hypothetical protein
MRLATIGSIILLGLSAASKTEAASILYTTTDLGIAYYPDLLRTNADGSTYGVT